MTKARILIVEDEQDRCNGHPEHAGEQRFHSGRTDRPRRRRHPQDHGVETRPHPYGHQPEGRTGRHRIRHPDPGAIRPAGHFPDRAWQPNHRRARSDLAEPFGYIFKPFFEERELISNMQMALYKLPQRKGRCGRARPNSAA
ncbi:MAG: hypothetical protein MZV64_17550 [Ignavibacteriales bacterium]|nr:hypothetical protein [Ignavibacteriales bacterium]